MSSTRRILVRILLIVLPGCLSEGLGAERAPRTNVVFIVADDLRNDLGCYGNREVVSPHLDALARRGRLFNRAYCQQAVCNPSRASVLTGLRPDTIRVWDLRAHFRDALPGVVTLPQHFKNHGYHTVGIGKLFHNESGSRRPRIPFADPVSWSEPPVMAEGAHWQDWVVPGDASGPRRKGGAVQCLDVADDAYLDGRIADAAVARLRELRSRGGPFFLGVGFWKPHLPFNAPKRYWDLYDRAALSRAQPVGTPAGAPPFAGHDSPELRGYSGIPPSGDLPAALQAELRHGYLAAISFLDAQVGKVLAALRELGLEDNTLVVFWSDHGFHLGERAIWGKSTNYELDTRVPLIVAGPGVGRAGAASDAIVELVDLFPTLAELCGLPADARLEGSSFVTVLRNPAAPGKAYALSQHPRPYFNGELTLMGYSLRSTRHRYVEWRARDTGAVLAQELYDHGSDALETRNLADEPSAAALVSRFEAALSERAPRVAP